ncbi:MAG: anti-sigma factor domain-containing protein, partial [Microbacterium sp.]
EEAGGSGPDPRPEDDAPDTVPAAPAARRAGRRWFALAASVVVVAGIGVGAVVMTQLLDRPEGVVALDRIEGADDARGAAEELPDGGSLVLRWSHEVGEVVVLAGEMPELDDGSQYELWFVRDETPVSAGVFDGGDAEPALLQGELADGDVVAVTVEADGGSPTGEPTTDPLAAIPTD